MSRHAAPSLSIVAGMLSVLGCAAPGSQLTYDRYDKGSATYINDTAGFAMVFGRDWRVTSDADMPVRLFNVFPVPTGTEITLKAMADGVGLWVETSRVPANTPVERLQPLIYQAYQEFFRQLRYQQLSLEKKAAHGIDYVEWVYQLKSPDRDDTMVEALFIRAGYAVRIRARTTTGNYDSVAQRIDRLLGSLTAVDNWTGRLVTSR